MCISNYDTCMAIMGGNVMDKAKELERHTIYVSPEVWEHYKGKPNKVREALSVFKAFENGLAEHIKKTPNK